MAICPFAVWRPLPENSTQPRIAPRAVVLHTAVSAAQSLYGHFLNFSDLESHFYVNEFGIIEQYLDTTIRADANLNANGFAVSIETWDGGTIRPWNPLQVEAIVRLVDWLCATHGIPRVQIPRWDGAGIGWHVMWGAPGPWTPVAKECPGGPRIDQTRNVIIPRVAAGQIVEDLLTPNDVWMAPCVGKSPYDGHSEQFPAVTWLVLPAYRTLYIQQLVERLASALDIDLDEVKAGLTELRQRPTADVDEAELARELSAIGWGRLPDEELARIAVAAADEQDRRERERLAA